MSIPQKQLSAKEQKKMVYHIHLTKSQWFIYILFTSLTGLLLLSVIYIEYTRY